MDCYDYPQYWDLAFQDETKQEADFVDAVSKRYASIPVKRIYEPGCGGGRLVVELLRRGYEVEAVDLSETAVEYVRRRLKRAGQGARIECADMATFVTGRKVDLVINTMNTFRHLTSEESARMHLESVSKSLRKGGLFILGMHLLPPDASLEDCERWVQSRGRTRVTTTLKVMEADRRKRYEVLRFNLRVKTPTKDLKLRSEYRMRIYNATQIRRLLHRFPALEICDVFDFWYDIDEPLKLSDEMGDTVFVMRKR